MIARALVVVALLATRAGADPARAWAVARANLPASAKAVLGVDVDKAKASSLSAFAVPLSVSLGARSTLDSFKTQCKIDPLEVIDGLVLVEGATSGTAVYYVAIDTRDGFGKDAVTRCLTTLKLETKLTATWLDDDVVAIAATPGDTATLTTFTRGRGAFVRSPLGKLVAKANTSAAIWFASTKSRAVQAHTMKSGHGAIDFATKTLSLAAEMTFTSARESAAVAKVVNDQIIALLASGRLDAIVMEMLGKVSVTTKGAQLVVAGALPDDQLMSLIGTLAQ